MPDHKIFCAIDNADPDRARELIARIAPVTGAIKLGLEVFNALGPKGLSTLIETDPQADFFIDLKYHDIPNTVAKAIKALSRQVQPAYLNVHCSGGSDMMKAARQACPDQTRLLGVTILTSLDQEAMNACGYQGSLRDNVRRLAVLAKECELDGVVCSPLEIEDIRSECGPDFDLIVPGIRPSQSDNQDQKRVMTPVDAIQAGATHLVIGRPITGSSHPADAARNILNDLKDIT